MKPKDIMKGVSHCLRYPSEPLELVVVRLNLGARIRGQSLNMKIFDSDGNVYREKDDLFDKTRVVFTTTNEAVFFEVCLYNVMTDLSWTKSGKSKDVVVDVEVGDDARNENKFTLNEKYAPLSDELKRVEMMYEVVERDLAGLVEKEIRLRNINELTQASHAIYQIVIVVILVVIGLFQVVVYRGILKSKKVI